MGLGLFCDVSVVVSGSSSLRLRYKPVRQQRRGGEWLLLVSAAICLIGQALAVTLAITAVHPPALASTAADAAACIINQTGHIVVNIILIRRRVRGYVVTWFVP
jgi:hypothetical protein